jgi:hypothetical protein
VIGVGMVEDENVRIRKIEGFEKREMKALDGRVEIRRM